MDPVNAQQQMVQQNALQRAAVLANAVKMTQQIAGLNVSPAQQSVLNIPPRNVGLLQGFIVEVTATLTNGATTAAARTNFGSANLVKNFTFTDLSNNVRINVPGYYLAILNSARQGFGFGGAYAPNLAMDYGNNFNVNQGPATIAADADATVKHIYYVPISYSGDDLRGSIYSAIVSATMNLQITLNTTPFVGATDPINAIYSGNAGGGYKANSTVAVNVYQVYLDQLPIINGGPVVPMLDLNTIYELKQTTLTGVAAGQDFPVPYAPFRDFLSTYAIFDNGGTFNDGTDINYWSLTSANFTNLFKVSPAIAALWARQTFMADVPSGSYYFSHRDHPINTIAFGNMELNLNASTVNANAALIVGFEAFASQTQLTSTAASSLAAG